MKEKDNKKNFRVPNKDIKIKSHELLAINTPTFWRLHSINQLGLAHFVYPFATHTRAAHSIECVDKAQWIVDALVNNEFSEVEKNEDFIRFSALLHDISHIPYAHSLEDENGILEKGDRGTRMEIIIQHLKDEILTDESMSYITFGFSSVEEYEEARNYCIEILEKVPKVLWTIALHGKEKYINLLAEKGLPQDDYYIADIVGNTISADLFAYLQRDVDFTGIEARPGGWYRIYDYFELKEDKEGRKRLAIRITKGGFRNDIITAIVGILNSRYALSEQVIFHHAKCAASGMLGRIVSMCDLQESFEPDDPLYKAGDEGFMNLLANKIEKLQEYTEDGRLYRESAQMLLHNLRCRHLHKPILVISGEKMSEYLGEKYHKKSERKTVEERIEKDFQLAPGSVIIFCPSSTIPLKGAQTMVIYENEIGDDTITQLNDPIFKENYHREIGQRVKNVEEQYINLWKLYVFLAPEAFPYAHLILKEFEEINIKGHPLLEKYHQRKREYSYKFSKTLMEVHNDLFEKENVVLNEQNRKKFYKNLKNQIQESLIGDSRLSPKSDMKAEIENMVKKAYKETIKYE